MPAGHVDCGQVREAHIVLCGGRELAYADLGRPGGPCVFFFHGAPMSRLHLVPLEEQFAARGLRVISPDRPGYGRSSPQPGRSLSDWPADVTGLADALGLDRFLVAGHSSGGAYAVACAALLAARVRAGIVLGGVTDMAWPASWSGYLEGRVEIGAMRAPDEDAARAVCAAHFGEDGSGFFDDSFEWPEPDLALLSDESVGKALTSAVVEAFRQGIGAYAQDVYLEGQGWPFDAQGIEVPVEVVHGELDTLVPVAHSHHTAALIPGATLRLPPGHGHLTTLSMLPEIAAGLARID